MVLVDFDKYPRVLLDVFDEASNPSKRDVEVTFAARRDGTAQLQFLNFYITVRKQ